MARSLMGSTQMHQNTFGAIGEISTPKKESKARQKSSKHCEGPYIDFDIDFH